MAENIQREQEIFFEALELGSAEERTAFLQAACGADLALQGKVEALLRAYDCAGGFIPYREERCLETALSEGPGAVIDRYRLLEKIGEGGFGVVFKAEQEEPVRRTLALKIIKLGMDTKQVIARFEAERQALAMMDHPNIAKVLDGSATKNGRPFFVMELVEGLPITDYCDQHNLATEARLELFGIVCQAIQHAHRKGIIHRDIKPSNVIVTLIDGRPVPKVIDFGIAKATQQRLTEKTFFTQQGQFIGTPVYMSPEQAARADEAIDGRTDIYSLGVLLYELLVGRTPFEQEDLLRAGYEEVRRKIREEDPVKPSTRLSTLGEKELAEVARQRNSEPRELGRRLHGDLDWIVMRALEKDPARRYDTPNGLAEDLQRHLKHEPVEAAAPSMGYRLQKYIRRNRRSLLTAGAIGCALVLGLVGSMVFQLRKARLRITTQPQGQTVPAGATVTFGVEVAGAGSVSYQWWFNGTQIIENATNAFLTVSNVIGSDCGDYSVVVANAFRSALSEPASLALEEAPISLALPPTHMVLIPEGPFEMGDHHGDGASWDEPVHTVQVSKFYMDKFEVTKTLWDSVYAWAVARRYQFDHPGFGEELNHPVHSINWYDAVKWCNARSEKEGLMPVYCTDASQAMVYKTDRIDLQNSFVNWAGNGYRLPTEAEWEKAARGGLTGQRYPWGDTITHSQANYVSKSSYPYDNSPTRGGHPATHGAPPPGTLPVGSFPPNGYGLHNMSGNVWEWCWDWYQGKWYHQVDASRPDPHGPGLGRIHVARGGSWHNDALEVRCAIRINNAEADSPYSGGGFRCVRGIGPLESRNRSPHIIEQPQSQWAGVGEDVAFAVKAGGVGPFRYQWQFNQADLAGATNSTLLISHVSPAQKGDYQVAVSNASGCITSDAASLVVEELVSIPPGTFIMGSPAGEAERDKGEGPQTRVTRSTGFQMGRHEVTQREFLLVMGYNPSWCNGRRETNDFGRDLNRPVERVTWFQATNYCARLTQQQRQVGRLPEGYVYRLPTEAEWEYACRAGTTTAFHYGPELRSGMANFDGRKEYVSGVGTVTNQKGINLKQTVSVGSYEPNAWGLHDMHGNVWEWCHDRFAAALPGGRVTDPTGPSEGTTQVIRGGSWRYEARCSRSAYRYRQMPELQFIGLGFRVVLARVLVEKETTVSRGLD